MSCYFIFATNSYFSFYHSNSCIPVAIFGKEAKQEVWKLSEEFRKVIYILTVIKVKIILSST